MVRHSERLDDSVGVGFILVETSKSSQSIPIYWFVDNGQVAAVGMNPTASKDDEYSPAAVGDRARLTAATEQAELLSYSITCNPHMDDATRALIVDAGYPLLHRTQADYRAHVAEMHDELGAYMAAKAEAEAFASAADTTPVSGTAPTVLPEHVQPLLVRVRKDGYGELGDNNIEDAIVHHAHGEIVHSLPAQGRAAAGLLVVPVREVCFIVDGVRRYMYVVVANAGDSYNERWWVSSQRLTAGAAAEAMIAALDLIRQLNDQETASMAAQSCRPN